MGMFIVRSPSFVNPSKATWVAQSGKGLADSAGDSDSSITEGFMGWAIRADGGNYVQSTRMSNNQHAWMDFSWDLSIDAGNYNFDIIDNQLGGGWSHIETQDFHIEAQDISAAVASTDYDYHWNADSGMLGWTQAAAATDTQKYMNDNGGDGWMGPVPFGSRDNAHEMFIVRSPTFATPTMATWIAQGGKGLAADAGASDAVTDGFMGWALRAADGSYVQSTTMSNNQHAWMDFSWDLSVDAGDYNFDIIDNQLGGGWSHIETQDFHIEAQDISAAVASTDYDYHWNADSGMLGWTQAAAATDTQKYMNDNGGDGWMGPVPFGSR